MLYLILIVVCLVLRSIGDKLYLRGMLRFYAEEKEVFEIWKEEIKPLEDQLHVERIAMLQRQHEDWMVAHKREHAEFMAEVKSWYNECTALVVYEDRSEIYQPAYVLEKAVACLEQTNHGDYYDFMLAH